MLSVKSYFNPTLLRKNFTRFWPIWGLYLFIWVLALPLIFLNRGFDGEYALGTLYLGSGMALCFGILTAMAVFSYLYNGKSVQLMHSLPVTRENLFLTNYFSGLLFLLVPNVIVFFLAVLAGGVGFHHCLILWLTAQTMMCLFFYSFAVFCAMFTGNLLALPVFYGILNGLAAGLAAVLNELMGQFLFGFTGTSALDQLILWLTPIGRIYRTMGIEARGSIYILRGMPDLLLYGLLAVPLTIAALLIYRRRRLETAGDLVSVFCVRPIFKYGVAFCVSVTLGSYLYYTFRSLMPAQRWGILLPLIFAGLLGYFVAEMLLKKRFNVFSAGWKGCLVFSLALVCAFIVTNNDLVGFNRTPSRATIASVELSGVNSTPYDTASYSALTLTRAEDIDAALALHRAIVSNRAAIQAEEAVNARNNRNMPSNSWRPERLPDGTEVDINYSNTTNFYIDYTLTDGSTMRRGYTLPLQLDRLSQSGSIEEGLTALFNSPSLVEQSYWSGIPTDARLVDATISMSPYSKNEGDLPTTLEGEDARNALLAAVKADIAAGRLGRRYLFEDVERYTNCYYNDLTFSFYRPSSDDDKERARDWQVTVTLQTSATETLKVLRSLGYTEGEELITWAEYRMREGNIKYGESTERYVD